MPKRINPGFAARCTLAIVLLAGVCQAAETHGRVVDRAGLPVAGATILMGGQTVGHTDADGRFFVSAPSGATLTFVAGGFQTTTTVNGTGELTVTLKPAQVEQQATVTTTRSSVDLGPSANTVATLSSEELTQYPALTLDERLRQHAGFELFRRSSSWVANPTSEGISLRGLGSTAASRTLVLADSVPLNDAFGGWIHWNEIPPEAIDAVTLAAGGGSDLYGSSALGGVIDIVPARPGAPMAEADLAAASEDTTSYRARIDERLGRWGALAAGQSFRTDGYTTIAPSLRGAVDVPSNVHFQTGRLEIDRKLAQTGRAFVLGNVLNEAHGNGTLLTTNGTRLWRYVAGDDWNGGKRLSGRVRGFGSDEAYRQSFSSVNAARSSETLTRLQRVETQEFGVSSDASFHRTHVALVTGGDLRDLRATDFETPFAAGKPNGVQDVSARQRFYGGFGEVVAEHGGWSGAASLRADEAQNLATRTVAQSGTGPQTATATPDRTELVFSPRVGLVRQLPLGIALHGSGFRAFRAATMNELYRTGQVGAQITQPNAGLLSERATGAEGGVNWTSPRKLAGVQATYFWTEINRPVAAVLVSGNTYLRQNLGQIQSQGTEVAAQIHPLRGLSIHAGYQYAHAVVTAFRTQTTLIGLWIPDVSRHMATAQIRYQHGPATVTLAGRESGRSFDDSANTLELHGFFVLDAYAETRLGRSLTAYVSLQNLLNRSIETARTPNLTLGTQFTAQGGLRLRWGGR